MRRLETDSITGQLFTDGTWEYKIPCAQDVPLEMNVEFFPLPFERVRSRANFWLLLGALRCRRFGLVRGS